MRPCSEAIHIDPDGGWMTGDGRVWASCSGMEIACIGPGKVRAEVMNSNGERSMERIGFERAGSSIRGTSERSESYNKGTAKEAFIDKP